MNLVIDDAVEVKQPTRINSEENRRDLGPHLPCKDSFRVMLNRSTGQILLKGDNVSLIQALQ